jgi:polar amino acid transport system substrate-binding protein
MSAAVLLARLPILLLSLLLAAAHASEPAKPPPSPPPLPILRIASGELPPYATASRADQGLALAIVRRAFELGGYRVQFQFLPWSRSLAETREGLWDATAHWGATPERRKDFLLSDNLYTEQWQMLHRRDTSFDWKSVADLATFRLGLTRDYTYTPEIWAAVRAGQLRSESPPNDVLGLRMLLAGRIDVLPLDRNVACEALLANFSAAEQSQVMIHPRLMTDSFTTHVLFPPTKAQSRALLDAFNRGLRALRASGEYPRLIKGKVQCPAHWAGD